MTENRNPAYDEGISPVETPAMRFDRMLENGEFERAGKCSGCGQRVVYPNEYQDWMDGIVKTSFVYTVDTYYCRTCGFKRGLM